jgi:predicted ATPase
VSIYGCAVLAIDGTHSAGKTTLAIALTEYYRASGIDAAYVCDPARDSPLVAHVVADPNKAFDLLIEVDLLAATITNQIRAAHHRALLVTDKTVANVLAYARLFLTEPEQHAGVFLVATQLCHVWQPYDLVVRCTDHFAIDLATDPYRAKVTQLQDDADHVVRDALTEVGYPVIDLPMGMSTFERIAWITACPATTALTAALTS